MAFIMFRAGLHQQAIDFLENSPNGSPQKGFAHFYRIFFKTHGKTFPVGEIAQFLRDCEKYSGEAGVKHDLYLDALIHLMIGSDFNPASESVFWDCLVPMELET